MKTCVERLDRYRNEAMALAARPTAEFRVQIRHADREAFAEAKAWNRSIEGMASVAVRNEQGELLFINNEGYGGWVMPGGQVEPGESFRRGAVREVHEESGVEASLSRPLFVYHFVNRYDGMSTDSSLVIFEGEAVDPEPAENPGVGDEAITDVRWCSTVPRPLPDDAFVRETIRAVADKFETVERPGEK